MIGKGCTCRNTFTLPFNTDKINAICIVYCQNDKVLLKKQLEDCSFSNKVVTVELSQEDTLNFDHSKIIKIQLKIKLKDDTVVKSNVIETITDELLCCEVI